LENKDLGRLYIETLIIALPDQELEVRRAFRAWDPDKEIVALMLALVPVFKKAFEERRCSTPSSLHTETGPLRPRAY
jgi:hypothetical protein